MGYSLTGYHDWELHSGLNMSLDASVLAGFGKHAPSGVGFAQNVSGIVEEHKYTLFEKCD